MPRLFPVLNEVYLHNTALDLYLKTLREAMQSIPIGVLKLEEGCSLVITDFTDPRENEQSGISLGYGFHYSDFTGKNSGRPYAGLVFCLNPPLTTAITDIKIYVKEQECGLLVHSSFKVGKNRFLLIGKEFNLDEVVCGILRTGEIYKKPTRPKQYKPYPPNAVPF